MKVEAAMRPEREGGEDLRGGKSGKMEEEIRDGRGLQKKRKREEGERGRIYFKITKKSMKRKMSKNFETCGVPGMLQS